MRVSVTVVIAITAVVSTIMSVLAGVLLYNESKDSLVLMEQTAMQSLNKTVNDIAFSETELLVDRLNASFEIIRKTNKQLEIAVRKFVHITSIDQLKELLPPMFWGTAMGFPEHMQSDVTIKFKDNKSNFWIGTWYDMRQDGGRTFIGGLTEDNPGINSTEEANYTKQANCRSWSLDPLNGSPVSNVYNWSAEYFLFTYADKMGKEWQGIKYWVSVDNTPYMYFPLAKTFNNSLPSDISQIQIQTYFRIGEWKNVISHHKRGKDDITAALDFSDERGPVYAFSLYERLAEVNEVATTICQIQ